MPVSEIWEWSSPRLAQRLTTQKVTNILHLKEQCPETIRQRSNVTAMGTVLELQGIACIEPEESRKGQEQLIYSRSFSHTINTRQEFSHVLSLYTQNAVLRLATHGLQASVMNLWAQTSPFTQHIPHTATCTVALPVPTADPVILTKAAQPLLEQLNPEARYARAGVILTGLSPLGQQPVLEPFLTDWQTRDLSGLLEKVHQRFGSEALGLGYAGMRGGAGWQMKRELLSPREMTHWDELVTVLA